MPAPAFLTFILQNTEKLCEKQAAVLQKHSVLYMLQQITSPDLSGKVVTDSVDGILGEEIQCALPEKLFQSLPPNQKEQ